MTAVGCGCQELTPAFLGVAYLPRRHPASSSVAASRLITNPAVPITMRRPEPTRERKTPCPSQLHPIRIRPLLPPGRPRPLTAPSRPCHSRLLTGPSRPCHLRSRTATRPRTASQPPPDATPP